VAHSNKETQTVPVSSRDQLTDVLAPVATSDAAIQVLSRPHQGTSSTQTPALASTSDQGQQVLLQPPCSVAWTQTARLATSRTSSWTQTHIPASTATGTGMSQVLTMTTGCQAGAYFNNDEILPGVPRPRLPWAYSYAQFSALLTAYPDAHPEDFVTFGVLQAQPCRGSQWGRWPASWPTWWVADTYWPANS